MKKIKYTTISQQSIQKLPTAESWRLTNCFLVHFSMCVSRPHWHAEEVLRAHALGECGWVFLQSIG
jgi:hypothetical protein